MLNNIDSISAIISNGKELYPNKIAVADSEYDLTYEDLYLKSIILSDHFVEHCDVSFGDAVAFLIPNSVEFVLVHFAVQFAGAISVPLDPDINPDKLKQCLDLSDVNAILIKDVSERKCPADEVSKIKVIDYSVITELLKCSLGGLGNNISNLNNREFNVNEIASYMFTTGSTGVPKGVVMKQAHVVQALTNITEFIGYSEYDSEIITLPLSHNFGLGHLYCNLLSGGTAYLIDGISNFKLLFDLLIEKRPTGFPGTPSGFNILAYMFPGYISECRSFIKFMVINSEKCPPELVKRMHSLLPETEIIIYYGLTEASRSTFIKFRSNTDDYYLDSVGLASPNVQIRIVDQDMSDVGRNKEGRVSIAGRHVVDRYLGSDNMLNKRAGWLVTDDIGYIDDDGYLFLTGRLSSFINKAGLKVDPKEIESVISSIAHVKDVAVVGLDDGISGEKICVCYVTDALEFSIEKVIMKVCNQKLEKIKIPDMIVCVNYIPRNKTGKLLQHELKELVLLEGS